MGKKTRWLLPTVALAGLLFFGPATSKTYAWGGGPRVAFTGRFGAPLGRARFFGSARFGRRPFFVGHGAFHRPFFRASFRPFRVVRVFVYDPFPHWAFRRIYDPYCYGY